MSDPKSITQAIDAAQIGQKPARSASPDTTIKQLFMLLHGLYGNLLIARFSTGEVVAAGPDKGKDKGVKSAMVIWQANLDRFDGETIRAAADRCMTDHPKYPPTLPEFVAMCKAIQPRQTHAEQFKIGMSDELKSSYTARARAQAMARYRANLERSAGVVNTGNAGLGALQVLIARAVALAGGDEVAALRRFDYGNLDGGSRA